MDLFDVGIPLGRWGEDANDIQRVELGIGGLFLRLHRLEQAVVFDGVIDRLGGEDGIEAASGSGGIVFGEDGFDDSLLRNGFAGLRSFLARLFLWLEVVHMETKDVSVLDGVGDGVGVELLLEEVLRGTHGGSRVLDLLKCGIGIEDGRSGEAEELCLGKELLDSLVILSELRTVAFVEDEDDAFISQGFELFLVCSESALAALFVALAVFIQSEAELLNGGDDDLVGVILGKEATDKSGGVGVFFDAALLEAVELLARLAVEVLAVHDEEAFMDVLIEFEQRGGLEGSEGLAATGGVPDVAIAVVLFDALHDVLNGIDLVGPYDHEFLLTLDEHHVATDGLGEDALLEKAGGEIVEVGDLLVGLVRELVDGQEALVGIEGEVASVVVGKVVGAVAIADDKELEEAEDGLGVTVAGIVLVFDDLLHGLLGIHAEGLQFDLHAGHAIDEQEDIVAAVAVVRVDTELVDDLKMVLAPVLQVDEGIVQGRAVIACETVDLPQGLRGGEDIWGDDLIEQAGKLRIGELAAV